MELGTFGAIFQAAITLEEYLISRYTDQSAHHETYRVLAKGGAKRLKRLKRLRRETITEMILEPISGLRLSDGLAGIASAGAGSGPGPGNDTPLSPEEAHRLERGMSDFYNDAADKIGLAEAARALRRMSKESAKRADQLASLTDKV